MDQQVPIIKLSKSYILTLFLDNIENSWKERLQALHSLLSTKRQLVFLQGQLEKCPTTQRLHLQAFVKTVSQHLGTWFQNQWDKRTSFIPVTVERAEAIDYGGKPETRIDGPLTWGERPSPKDKYMKGGEAVKIKWDLIKKAILEQDKASIPTEIVIQHRLEERMPNLKAFWDVDNRKELSDWDPIPNPWGLLLQYCGSSKTCKKRHFWFYSTEGSIGKTTEFAEPLVDTFRALIQSGGYIYWNLKGNEQIIICDEFNTAKLRFDELNAMCDGSFAYRRFRGGMYQFTGPSKPIIVVLGNQRIETLYPNMHSLLHLRFQEICLDPYRKN